MSAADPRDARRADARSTERTEARTTSGLDGCAAEWRRLDTHHCATGQDERDHLYVQQTLYRRAVDM